MHLESTRSTIAAAADVNYGDCRRQVIYHQGGFISRLNNKQKALKRNKIHIFPHSVVGQLAVAALASMDYLD